MKKQSFLQGALVLMLAGFINRIIGFALRIIIVRTIGDEGLGLFQMIFPLFMTLLLICTAGFPVAISKIIPEKMANNDLQGSYNLLKVSLLVVFIMSIIIITSVFFLAEFLTENIFADERTYMILLAILPALFFSSLASCFRGFFQGMHTMMPTAVSQISEQLTRLLATIMIINAVAYLGIKYQAAGIALGISIGEFSGLLILIILFIYTFISSHRKKIKKLKNTIKRNLRYNYKADLKAIAALAIPITMGRIIHSLMMSAEAILIPRQLQISGLSVAESTALYGQLSGMVEQLIFLPTVITIALTVSLVPNVSDAFARNNMQKIKNNYQDVIRISFYLGLPIIVVFSKFGAELCDLLFGYPEAGSLLAAMAFAAPFLYYLQVSHGMLNGLGKPQISVINLGLGSLLKLFGIFYLTRGPLGIYAAAISIGLGAVLSASLNFIAIGHYIGYKINVIQTFIKPIFASLVLFFLSTYIKSLNSYLSLNTKLETVISLLLMILFYLFIMYFIKAIRKEDLERFKK
ncbi:putative polysaccharide biosynthesis protein [Natronospora cellulosivora (SeqCode)]